VGGGNLKKKHGSRFRGYVTHAEGKKINTKGGRVGKLSRGL